MWREYNLCYPKLLFAMLICVCYAKLWYSLLSLRYDERPYAKLRHAKLLSALLQFVVLCSAVLELNYSGNEMKCQRSRNTWLKKRWRCSLTVAAVCKQTLSSKKNLEEGQERWRWFDVSDVDSRGCSQTNAMSLEVWKRVRPDKTPTCSVHLPTRPGH